MVPKNSELRPRDPRLAAVVDKKSQRNLLTDPAPVVVDTKSDRVVKIAVAIENGPESMMELDITSSKPWLVPQTNRLSLLTNEKRDCIVSVRPDGEGELANLLLSWQGAKRKLNQSVAFIRSSAVVVEPPGEEGQKEKPGILTSVWTLAPLCAGLALLMFSLANIGPTEIITFLGMASLLATLGSMINQWLLKRDG